MTEFAELYAIARKAPRPGDGRQAQAPAELPRLGPHLVLGQERPGHQPEDGRGPDREARRRAPRIPHAGRRPGDDRPRAPARGQPVPLRRHRPPGDDAREPARPRPPDALPAPRCERRRHALRHDRAWPWPART
ncbi:MAG: hypothetical protein MZU79_06225 [Anaerotruncus sp.]|nr:hypothetical protein [Anaerotruncus sp.]